MIDRLFGGCKTAILSGKIRENSSLPGPCSFTEDSEWVREFGFDQVSFIPTHYVFVTLDEHIGLLGQDEPQVREIANDAVPKEESTGVKGDIR